MEMNIFRHITTQLSNLSNFKSTLKKKYFSENGHFSQIFKEFVKSINILTIHGPRSTLLCVHVFSWKHVTLVVHGKSVFREYKKFLQIEITEILGKNSLKYFCNLLPDKYFILSVLLEKGYLNEFLMK